MILVLFVAQRYEINRPSRNGVLLENVLESAQTTNSFSLSRPNLMGRFSFINIQNSRKS